MRPFIQLMVRAFLISAALSQVLLHAAESPEPELLIAGLYVNDVEKEGADIYRDKEEYWLPLQQLLEWADIQAESSAHKTTIHTPLGSVDITSQALLDMPEGQHIRISALKDMGIAAHFDQSAYALVLYAPWVGLKPAPAALTTRTQEALYTPPEAGVSRLYNRLDAARTSGDNSTGLYSDAMGYLVDGSWGLQTTTNQAQRPQLSQLYWHTFNRYTAIRLGTTKANPGPLLETPDFTGVQMGYSNHSVYNHLSANTSVSRQMFIDDASYSHDIQGKGPKGGIAELRINDRPVSRIRIALDGRFLFKRLPITQGNTDLVEVALYNHSLAQPPSRTIDYTTASTPRAVSTGEVMLNAGIGTLGSTLEDSAEGGSTSYGSLRYGLSNFLTLEAATQQQAKRADGWYLGFIASLGSKIATSIGSAHTGSKDKHGAEIWSHWSNVKANYKGNQETDHRIDSRSESHDLSIHWQFNESVSLIARGLVKSTNKQTQEEYFSPGFNWKITPYSTLSLQPSNNDYDARLSLRSSEVDANLQLRSSKNSYGLGANYAFNPALSLGGDYSMREKRPVISTALDYRPRHNNDSVYSAQLSRQDKKLGVSLGWHYRLSPRTQFNFNYYRQLKDNDALLEAVTLDDKESLALSIESELWFSPRGWRVTSLRTDSTHGAVSARVLNSAGELLSNKDISLQIASTKSPLKPGANGEQHLAGLPPGDYDLELLAEGLPIEYEGNTSDFRIHIAPAATTHVDIVLKAHYGVSGLLLVDAQPAAHTWVDVWQDDKKITQGKTDSYGYYQIAGLLPGQYELRHEKTLKAFKLIDDYLFDVDITSGGNVPNSSALIVATNTKHKTEAEAEAEAESNPPLSIYEDSAELPSLLSPGLSGQVFYKGKPLAHATVRLQGNGVQRINRISDDNGFYAFQHLHPGVYRVTAGNTSKSYSIAKGHTYNAHIYINERASNNDGITP